MMSVGVPVGLSHWGRGYPAFLLAKKPDNPVPNGSTLSPTALLSTFPTDVILMKIYECKAGRL